MTYYSCYDLMVFSGPRGIRTLDLLNAIETRSQLRYGPLFSYQSPVISNQSLVTNHWSLVGGPGGIRTRDLFSAIEALSQLSHRPISWACVILTEGLGNVKQRARWILL